MKLCKYNLEILSSDSKQPNWYSGRFFNQKRFSPAKVEVKNQPSFLCSEHFISEKVFNEGTLEYVNKNWFSLHTIDINNF